MNALIRVVTVWSWLASTTGTAVMLAPHVPLLVAQRVVEMGRR